MRARLLAASIVCVLGASLPRTAGAQAPPGSLEGRVSAAGRAVAGATVAVSSGVKVAETRSDEDGRYAFSMLAAGPYVLHVHAPGYRGATLPAVDLAPGDRLRIDVALTAGAADEPAERIAWPVPLTGDLRARLSGELLERLPIAREQPIVSVSEVLPGIGNGSAFGAAAGTSMVFRIDGLETSDPYDGSPLASFVLPAAGQVTLTGPGRAIADGNSTGAVLDSVLRPVSAASSALVDVLVTTDGLRGDNVSDDRLAANPLLATPDRLTQSTDVSVAGGGVPRDRLMVSGALGYGRSSLDPTGPRTNGRRTTTRIQGRLIAAGTSQRATASLLVEAPEESGVLPLEYAQTLGDELANTRDHRTVGGQLTWSRQLGSWEVMAGYGFLTARRRLTPAATVSGRLDPVTATASGSLGVTEAHDRRRHSIRAMVGRNLRAWGRHRVEAGTDVEITGAQERVGFVGGELFVDPGGRPAFVIEWDGLDRDADARRIGLLVEDTWQPGGRITVQAGVRGDVLRGSGASGGRVYAATSWQPRGNVSVDLTGAGRLIARASAGIYADRLLIAHFDRAVSGEPPLITREILANGTRREIERVTPPGLTVDEGLRHPEMREITGGVEYRAFRSVTATFTFVRREFTHFVDAVFPDGRWLAFTRPGLPSRTVTLYRWFNRASSEGTGRITNVDGFAYRAVNGSTLGTASAERQYTGLVAHARAELWRRQAEVHATFVHATVEGTVDDSFAAGLNRSFRFASPSASLVNAEGTPTRTPEQELTIFATSRVPGLPLRASAVYVAQFAPRYHAVRTFPADTLDFPYGTAGREVRLEPLGVRTLPAVHALDLRVEHTLRLGARQRVTVYADVMNALNRAAVLEVQSRHPVVAPGGGVILGFEAPLVVQAPRQVFIGGRWGF